MKTLAKVLVLAPLAATAVRAEPTAFVGATVHPVSAAAIENAVLLVDGGRIVAVGAGLAVPAGARVVDLAGKHLYPGFIHPDSTLGLVEISSVRGTVDTSEVGDLNSDLRVEVAFNADSQLLDATLSGGVLTAHVRPAGGIFNGTSAVMRLRGWNREDMTLRAPVGMFLTYPRLLRPTSPFFTQSEEDFEKEKKKSLGRVEEIFAQARAYQKARAAASAGQGRVVERDAKLEALLPVLDGQLPLFIRAGEKTQIESALDWAKKEGLGNLVLVAGADAAYLAERLARDHVAVIVDGVLSLPDRRWEPYDTPFTAPARLHAAGVRFAIGDGGGTSNARNLPFEAAMAAAFGLPKDVALRSVTLSAAEILGIADRLGSLDVGKEATFIATDGDPLEIRTTIERAWVAGEELDLSRDRQKQLYERYRNRPRPEAGGGSSN